MRNYTVEYVTRLEEKQRIAEDALSDVINYIDCEQPDLARFVASQALIKIEESDDDKLLKSFKQAENGEFVEVNVEDL